MTAHLGDHPIGVSKAGHRREHQAPGQTKRGRAVADHLGGARHRTEHRDTGPNSTRPAGPGAVRSVAP
jgi:hypothetical protein